MASLILALQVLENETRFIKVGIYVRYFALNVSMLLV